MSYAKKICLWLVVSSFVLVCLSNFLLQAAGNSANKDQKKLAPVVIRSYKHDVSPSLRAIQAAIPPEKIQELQEKEKPIYTLPKAMKKNSTITPDPFAKGSKISIQATPAPSLTFEGLSNIDNYWTIGFRVLPPDTNGDIGPNYYVEMINLILAVYDKAGNKVFGPIPNNAVWTGFGGPCESDNSGDPIVQYDHLADRWLVSQFSISGPPYHECIAISQTGDPTGSYYRYAFEWPNSKFPDYPKIGVWTDGYYMSANQFTTTWAGAGVAAFERDKMLQGLPAQMIYFDLYDVNINYGGMLPSDLDGNPPPAETPNYFAEVDDEDWIPPSDAIRIWEFHVDWTNPGNSTFGINGDPNYTLDTAAWEPLPCVGFSRDCIPQPGVGSSAYLDAIGDRLMYRLQYRNTGNRQSLVVNHTVWADGADRAGVRWYHILLSGTTECGGTFPCIYKENTQAPADGLYRWMGSAALDNAGNLCIGYSTSSSTVYPSIAYACWLDDGTYEGEQTMYTGSGSQTHTASRWGDYSMLALDPNDDCSYWYINEYYFQTNQLCPITASSACWHTRVGSFKYSTCTAPAKCVIRGYVRDANTNNLIANALVKAGAYSKVTNNAGYYEIYLSPGIYDMEASAYGYLPSSVLGVDCSSGIANQDFYLNGVAIGSYVGSTLVDTCPYGGAGSGDGVIDPGETITVKSALKNEGFASITDAIGTLSSVSPYITVTDPAGAWPVIAPSASSYTSDDFAFSVDPNTPCLSTINYDLSISYTGQGSPINVSESAQVGTSIVGALLSEDFSAGIPPTWTTNSNGTCVYPWTDTNPCGRTPGSPIVDPFAIADSDCAGYGCGIMDEELITPSVDASSCAIVNLKFDNWFNQFSASIADVDVSIDGGTTWTNVLQMTTDDGYPTPNTKNIDISAIAAGQPDVRIRFHYYNANWSWYWAIDNVVIECITVACNPCVAPSNINPAGKLVDTLGNGIFEPGETVVFAPSWQNNESSAVSATGSVSNFTGPAPATYTILDNQADYGSIPPASISNCTSTGNCYILHTSVPASRPTHWDSTIDENISGTWTLQAQTWTIHMGNSFSDVPTSNAFYSAVETILHSGVAGGCTSTTYCPTGTVKRDTMAKFICNAMEASASGSCTLSGSCAGVFADVPASNPFCQHIEALNAAGVVGGCGGGNYCPTSNTVRDQMAKFVCAGMETSNPGSCVVGSCTGIFGDVPGSNPFCPYIEKLYTLNVVGGCQSTPLLYCPSGTVSREQMAKFIVNGFGFSL